MMYHNPLHHAINHIDWVYLGGTTMGVSAVGIAHGWFGILDAHGEHIRLTLSALATCGTLMLTVVKLVQAGRGEPKKPAPKSKRK